MRLYYGRSGDELCADCALEELYKVRVRDYEKRRNINNRKAYLV